MFGASMTYLIWPKWLLFCVFLWIMVENICVNANSPSPINFASMTKEQVVIEATRIYEELIETQCQCQCQSQCQCSGSQTQCQGQCQNQCQSQSNPTKPKTDCYDWLSIGGAKTSGIYQITPPGIAPFNVYCDMETDGGGWTVMQRRVDGTLSFYDKTWNEYKNGFNDGLHKNLWLGNEKIHALSTKDSNVELRIDLWGDRAPGSSYTNGYWWQKQSSFYIDSEANYYTLHLSSTVTGNASTSENPYHGINYNIGKPFYTMDNISDGCYAGGQGGWWSHSKLECSFSTLNGKYIPPFWPDFIGKGFGFSWLITQNNNNAFQNINPTQSRMMLRKKVQPLSQNPMTDCYDWLHIGGAKISGIYQITPPGIAPFNIYCDMETDGGGWTVMQRRVDGTLSFYDKTWNEYKNGFNDGLENNLWLGNDNIHVLSTKDANVELRIDLWGDKAPGSSHSNIYLWQKQSSFYIDSEANYYTLHLNSTLVGNASISGPPYLTSHGINYNIGKPFSTIDNIHDGCNGCCRDNHSGGWWLFKCGFSSLNGKYIWPTSGFSWYITGNNYIKPAQSRMMFRKKV